MTVKGIYPISLRYVNNSRKLKMLKQIKDNSKKKEKESFLNILLILFSARILKK